MENTAVNSNERQTKPQNNANSSGKKNNNKSGGQIKSNSRNKISNNTNANNTNNQADRKPRPVYPPCETHGKTSHSTENYYFGANAANGPPPGNTRPEGQQRNAQNISDGIFQAAVQTLN